MRVPRQTGFSHSSLHAQRSGPSATLQRATCDTLFQNLKKGGLQQSSHGALQASLLAIDTLVITTSACTISPLLRWADLDQFGTAAAIGHRLQPLLPHIPDAAHTRYTERLLRTAHEYMLLHPVGLGRDRKKKGGGGGGGLQQSSYDALQASQLAIDTLVITTSACTISPLLRWADLDQFGSNGRRHRPSPATPASTHTRCRAHALH